MSFTCKTCLYWQSEAAGRGICRRHAPSIVSVRGLVDNEQPITKESDWCGEGTADLTKAEGYDTACAVIKHMGEIAKEEGAKVSGI